MIDRVLELPRSMGRAGVLLACFPPDLPQRRAAVLLVSGLFLTPLCFVLACTGG